MIEKVRLSVEKETEEVINRVVDSLEGRLKEETDMLRSQFSKLDTIGGSLKEIQENLRIVVTNQDKILNQQQWVYDHFRKPWWKRIW